VLLLCYTLDMQQSPEHCVFVIYTKNFGQVLVGEYSYNGQPQTVALPRFTITSDQSELLEDAKKFVLLQLGISLESITPIKRLYAQDRQLRIFTATLTTDELPTIKKSSEIQYSFEDIKRALDLLNMDDQSADQEVIRRTMPLFRLEFSDENGDGILSVVAGWSLGDYPDLINLATSSDEGDAPLDFIGALINLSTKGYATIRFDPEGLISTMILLRSNDNVHMIIYTDTPGDDHRYDEDVKAVVCIDTYVPYDLFMMESMRALRQYVDELDTRQWRHEYGKEISEALAKIRL